LSRKSEELENAGGFEMKALRYILKWLQSLLDIEDDLSNGIDSHKWESKIEIMTNLSCRHC